MVLLVMAQTAIVVAPHPDLPPLQLVGVGLRRPNCPGPPPGRRSSPRCSPASRPGSTPPASTAGLARTTVPKLPLRPPKPHPPPATPTIPASRHSLPCRTASPFAVRAGTPVAVTMGVQDMLKNIGLACLSLAAAFAAQSASAQYPTQTTITRPFYQPGAGPQVGGNPYVTPGSTVYPPGSSVAPPTLNSRAASAYPPGAQTCVAQGYICQADAPNTVGNPCTCPTQDGGSAQGVVH